MFGRRHPEVRTCHYTGGKSPCVGDKCTLWVSLPGVDPTTGQPKSLTGCYDAFQWTLVYQQVKNLDAIAAEVSALRAETREANNTASLAMAQTARDITGLCADAIRKIQSVFSMIEGAMRSQPRSPRDDYGDTGPVRRLDR